MAHWQIHHVCCVHTLACLDQWACWQPGVEPCKLYKISLMHFLSACCSSRARTRNRGNGGTHCVTASRCCSARSRSASLVGFHRVYRTHLQMTVSCHDLNMVSGLIRVCLAKLPNHGKLIAAAEACSDWPVLASTAPAIAGCSR